MNRKLISRAISDIDSSFIEEAMCPPVGKADHSPERASNMGKYENKRIGVSSRRLVSLVAAACLVFALGVTVYALNLFGIREIFRAQNRELPESADPYIQQHTEAAASDDWSARVTESLCDPARVIVTVVVSGGDRYIVVPTDATPEHSAGIIGMEEDMTLGEYAAAQGKELLCVSASMRQNEELGIFTEMMTFESLSDSEMLILVDAKRGETVTAYNWVCCVYAVNEAGELEKLELAVELKEAPVAERATFLPEDPNVIPGITVTDATIEQTPLGWTVRIISEATDQAALENVKWMACRELSYFEGGGFVLEEDGTWSTTWTMGKGNISDTLTVHFYDWDDREIGTMIFRKK